MPVRAAATTAAARDVTGTHRRDAGWLGAYLERVQNRNMFLPQPHRENA
jgi:hypothetical protein